MDHPKLNDQTSLGINIKWLIQIIVLAAMIAPEVYRKRYGRNENLCRFSTDEVYTTRRTSQSTPPIPSCRGISRGNKNRRNKIKYPIGEKIFLIIGWIAISPFILSEYIIWGFKWLIKKIKRKG